MVAAFFVIAVLTECVHAQGQGIAIYKENAALGDGSAKVFEYTMIRKMGEVTQYSTPNGQKVSLNQYQPQTIVGYLDLMSRPITTNQLGPIVNGVQSYRDIVKSYPDAARFLNRYIQASDEIIRRVNGGEVLFNGAWVSQAEYLATVQRADDSAKEANDKSREKKRAMQEQSQRLEIETRRHKQ